MTAPAPTAGRERLRAAISRILDVFVAREATPEEFEAWSGIAERYAERIEAQPPETVFWGLGTRGVISVTGMPTLLEAQPRLSEAGDRVEATVTYGAEHEGHPDSSTAAPSRPLSMSCSACSRPSRTHRW